ncbi:MAG: hypothetical protein WC246_00015 [Candidatus Paceibacterota bacterium]|jgi:hypothetical protein
MSLEDLEKELYGQSSLNQSRRTSPSTRQPRPQKADASPHEWSDDLYYARGGAVSDAPLTFSEKYGKWIMGGLVGVLVILMGFVGYYFYQYFTTKDTTLAIAAPSRVMAGVPFTVSVSFINTSKKNLIAPHLSLALPDGAYYVADDAKRVVDVGVGDLAPGDIAKQDFRVIAVGQALATYSFTAYASYKYDANALSGSFEKKNSVDVAVSDPAIGINFSAPEKVLAGQDFEIAVAYQNNSDIPFSNASFVLSLPGNFTLNNSSPTLSGSSVVVQQLNPGESGTLVLSGTLMGIAGSYATIGLTVNILVDGHTYPLQTNSATVAINQSPLALTIGASSQGGGATASGTPIVYPGQRIDYTLTFTNNAGVTLNDIVLRAHVVGSLLDTTAVSAQDGYFDGSTNTAQWTGSTVPTLAALAPGASGSVALSVPTKATYPIRQLSDKDFMIQMDAQIVSPTVPQNIVASSTVGMATLTVTVGGSLSFVQQVYAHEPSAVGIVNKGPIPPRVGVMTQYSVHWNLAAYGADFGNTLVTATLGPGVVWTGAVSANTSSTPTYNERTQQITWDVGSLTGGTGVINKGPQAVFQIAMTPQAYMVDSPFVLVNGVTVVAHDQSIDRDISQTVRAAGSRDIADPNLPQNYDRVLP